MTHIRLATAAIVSVTALSTSAFAADVGPTPYDWSGFYAGIGAGMRVDNSTVDTGASGSAAWTTSGESQSSTGDIGFTGGGILGYNWQIDRLVLGIEADLNYGGLSGDGSTAFSDPKAPFASSSIEYDANWFGTLRGRAGYAADNVLFYGTAGLAYGGLDTQSKLDDQNHGSTNWLALGWTAGGGVEYGIDRWSLGLDYLYVDLGSASYATSDVGWQVKDDVDYRFSVLRATAKYRF